MRNLGFIRSKLDFDFCNGDQSGRSRHRLLSGRDLLAGTQPDDEDIGRRRHHLRRHLHRPQHARRQCTEPASRVPECLPNISITRTTICPTVSSLATGLRMWNWQRIRAAVAILLQHDTASLKPVSEGGGAACDGLEDYCALATRDWDKVAEFLFAGSVRRKYVVYQGDRYIRILESGW